jgi:hypothetical protein
MCLELSSIFEINNKISFSTKKVKNIKTKMNNSTSSPSEDIQFSLLECQDLVYFKIMFDYLAKLLQYGSIIGLTFCIIVFSRIVENSKNENKGQMFKYFLSKSVFDILVFLTVILDSAYYCNNCGTNYVWQLWYIWIYYYAYTVFVSISNLMEIAATIDCYLLVTNKFKFLLEKRIFVGFLLSSIVFNVIINVHYYFIFKIVENSDGTLNRTTFTVIDSMDYIRKSYFPIINFSILAYRELLPLLILIVINILIMLTFKKVSARKRQMQGRATTLSNAEIRIQRAEKNKLKLIFIVSFSYILLRMPFTIYQVPFHGRNMFWECYYFPTSIRLYDLSFFIQIFNYYFFNNKFKKYFLLTIKLRKDNGDTESATTNNTAQSLARNTKTSARA